MNKGYKCEKCGRAGFATTGGLQRHKTRMHPYVPPPPSPPQPPVFRERSTIIATEDHSFLGGQNIDVGDVVWLVRKAVVLKITKTQGKNSVAVQLGITKRSWQEQQPI